jgi:hypothetical protein
LNLRPPGYEPGELPDCSTPRRGAKDSIPSVPWWTSVALTAFAVAVVASAIFALSAFARLKRLRASGDTLVSAAEGLRLESEALQRRAAHAAKRAQDVEEARGRLDRSLERLSLLTWALADARRGAARLRSAYLRK